MLVLNLRIYSDMYMPFMRYIILILSYPILSYPIHQI